jgi:ribA/ribD-fused uncharacterized protein
MEKIERFAGMYWFLSNFYPSAIVYDGLTYATVEHAYQASKAVHDADREAIRLAASPGAAKIIGRALNNRPGAKRADWDQVNLRIMRELIHLKFADPVLRAMLLATGSAELIEGNHWGDTFYGVCRGQGCNWLGKILMAERTAIRQAEANEATDKLP